MLFATRKFPVILISASIFLTFFSCKKDEAEYENIPAGAKVRNMEFTDTSTATMFQVVFRYDTDERVTHVYGHNGSFGSVVNAADTVFSAKFYYEGAGRLPFKITDWTLTKPYTHRFLTYDQNRQLVKDSSFLASDPVRNINVIYYRKLPGYLLAESGGNIDSFRLSSGNYTYSHRRYNSFQRAEYDNHVNPLNYLNIAPVFHVLSGDLIHSMFDYWNVSNKNNETLWQQANNLNFFPSSITIRMSYTYNQAGLPDTKIVYWDPTSTEIERVKYNYY